MRPEKAGDAYNAISAIEMHTFVIDGEGPDEVDRDDLRQEIEKRREPPQDDADEPIIVE